MKVRDRLLRSRKRACPRSRRAGRGAVLLEAAFTLTLLLTLLIGIYWIARAYSVYETVSHAAREGARLAVTPTCATCGNAYPTDDEIRAAVADALLASSLNPALTNPSPVSVERNVVLNPGSVPEERGVVVSFSYPFQLYIPFTSVHLTSLSLPTRVQMRSE